MDQRQSRLRRDDPLVIAARFSQLDAEANYDIISSVTGHWITQGIQGADALAEAWPDRAEAWLAGEEDFGGEPIDVAS